MKRGKSRTFANLTGDAASYLINLGIPHQFFNWVLCVKSVATENLDGVRSALVGNIAGQALGHGGHISIADSLKNWQKLFIEKIGQICILRCR